MKKKLIQLFCTGSLFFVAPIVHADSRTAKGVPVVEQLGITAGVALACNVDTEQLKNYEMIASRIIANPIKTEKEEKKALHQYAQAKLKAFKEQKQKSVMNCKDVTKRFEKQEIFKSVVYRDGTIKMPDGRVIKPARPIKTGKKKIRNKKKK